MQKNVRDGGPKRVSVQSRRKNKNNKYAYLNTKECQSYITTLLRQDATMQHVYSLLPSVSTHLAQSRRIFSVEFPHVSVDSVFVKEKPHGDVECSG